jgi:zinc/manganese transport system substrate-binding protein
MAIKELQNIRDALMAHDPAHATDYFTNESRYETTLRDLDDEVGRTTVDIKNRRLVCITNAFSYFLSRYEFPVAATVATPAALTAANTGNADAVLLPSGPGQPILNTSLLPVVKADPMDTGSASADFYLQVTRANAEALREGLPQ